MPAATRLPGRLLAYDVSPAIVTRWLPCTLTPWNWLSCVVDPRSELSELLKNRTPMERFPEDVTPRTRGLGRAVDGHAVHAGLGDGQVAEADLGRGVEVDGAQVRAADGEAGDVDVGDAPHQDPEAARAGLDTVPGAGVRATDVDVQQLGDAVVEPGAARRGGGGRGLRQRLAVEPDLGGRGARRERVLPGRRRGGGPAGRARQVVGAEDHRVRRGGVHGQRGALLAAAGGHGELLAVGAGTHQHRVAGLRLLGRGADRAERDGLAAGAAVGAQRRRAGDVVGLERALGDHLVGDSPWTAGRRHR